MRHFLITLVLMFPFMANAQPFGSCRLFIGLTDQTDPSNEPVISAFAEFPITIGEGSADRSQEETYGIPLEGGTVSMTVNLKFGSDLLYSLGINLRKDGLALGDIGALENQNEAYRHLSAFVLVPREHASEMPSYTSDELQAKHVNGSITGHSYIFTGVMSSCTMGKASQSL